MRAIGFYLQGYWEAPSNFRKVGSKMLTHKTFSFSQNTFFLKKEPVLRKYSSFGKAFLSKKRFVLKEKQTKRDEPFYIIIQKYINTDIYYKWKNERKLLS
jgi:hypothetical protein